MTRWIQKGVSAFTRLSAALVAVLIAAAMTSTTVAADSRPSSNPLWKLTLGEYLYSGYSGTDLNLRWRRDDTSVGRPLHR
jgi:hypothetical protein